MAVSCGVGRRHSSDPAWLWLWRRLAATALNRPLAWEPPYATGAAQKMAKRQKKKKKKKTKGKKTRGHIIFKEPSRDERSGNVLAPEQGGKGGSRSWLERLAWLPLHFDSWELEACSCWALVCGRCLAQGKRPFFTLFIYKMGMSPPPHLQGS